MINSINEIYLKKGRPLSLKIEITNLCNLKCIHCYARDEKVAFLGKEYVFDILRQAKELGIIFLHITGGECLAHPDFLEIYTCAYELGFKITILTNGTLFTDGIIEMLSIKKPYLIEISIYGTSPSICEDITGNREAYRNTFKNIKKLKMYRLNLLLKYILMDSNKNSLIPFMIFAQNQQLKYKLYYNIMPTKNNDKWVDLQVDSFVKELLNFYTIDNYYKKIETDSKEVFHECNAGKTFFNINCYGKLYFCDFLNTIVEDVVDLNDAINKIKESSKKYIKNIDMNKCMKCLKKTVCSTCIATLSNEVKFMDSCCDTSYRFEIKQQLIELEEL